MSQCPLPLKSWVNVLTGLTLTKEAAHVIIHTNAGLAAACGFVAKTAVLDEICVAGVLTEMVFCLLAAAGCQVEKQVAAAIAGAVITWWLEENALKFAAKKIVAWIPFMGEAFN